MKANSENSENGNKLNNSDNEDDENQEDEELPVVTLKNEDKIKVIKGIILLFLFSSVVIYSLIYCNVPMYNTNIVFQDQLNGHSNSNITKVQQYKVISRHIHKNSIQLQIIESSTNYNSSNSQAIPIKAMFLFSKNRMRLRITQSGNKEYQIPLNMFKSNDLDLNLIGSIEHISESNIGIHINTNPFGFKLYRKQTNDTLFNTITNNNSNETIFKCDKNYMQISTQLSDNHLTFGLKYSNSSFQATDGAFGYWNNWTIDKLDKSFLSIPNFISGNPRTKNFYGASLFSSSPMNIVLKDNILTYKIYNNIIDLIIVNGPKPRDIIIQLQKTFGMPLVPSLNSLNWQGNAIMHSEDSRDISKVTQLNYGSLLFPFKEIWIDDIYNSPSITDISFIDKNKGIEFIRYSKPIIDITSSEYDEAVKSNICLTSDGNPFIVSNTKHKFCLIDQYNPNTTNYYNSYTQTNKHNLVLQLFDYGDTVSFDFPSINNDYIIPLNSTFYDNSTMMNVHNIYSMKHAQNLFEISNRKGIRPLIFSQNTFIGSAQYTGKWMGYFENSWEGLKDAIRMTLRFNLLGIFGLIHEACGFHLFNSNPSRGDNDELCVRWIQFSSVNSFSRINGFETIPLLQQKYKDSILNSIKLREMLSLYIYSTMIRNSYEGGSILFPMFAYFMSDTQTLPVENLFKFEYQFMIGPNIMACPVVEPNETMTTYFPNEILYNFYTGEQVNKDKEDIKTIGVDLNQLPLFTRGGFITPIQIPPDDKPVLIEEMRNYPIKLIVSLDENYLAQGRLLIDDGVTIEDSYVQIEFVCLYNSNKRQLKIMFQFVENDYQIPSEHYHYFDSITFYGLRSKPSSIEYKDDNTTIDLLRNSNDNQMTYNSQLKVLDVTLKSNNQLKVNSKRPYNIILKDIS